MTNQFSKSRMAAEAAFGKLQSQFFSKENAVAENEYMAKVREDKTLRLREARLAKQSEDRARATSALLRKRANPA